MAKKKITEQFEHKIDNPLNGCAYEFVIEASNETFPKLKILCKNYPTSSSHTAIEFSIPGQQMKALTEFLKRTHDAIKTDKDYMLNT